jgi:hypothetical protein
MIYRLTNLGKQGTDDKACVGFFGPFSSCGQAGVLEGESTNANPPCGFSNSDSKHR